VAAWVHTALLCHASQINVVMSGVVVCLREAPGAQDPDRQFALRVFFIAWFTAQPGSVVVKQPLLGHACCAW